MLDIYGSDIVEYYIRSESGCMVLLWYQAYYAPGLPKYLHIFPPQVICTSEVYKGNFIYHYHDENYINADLNLKDNKPGWQKAEPV